MASAVSTMGVRCEWSLPVRFSLAVLQKHTKSRWAWWMTKVALARFGMLVYVENCKPIRTTVKMEITGPVS